jgi:hypothetical protein
MTTPLQLTLLLTCFFSPLALAEENDDEDAPPATLPGGDQDEALKMPSLSRAQHDWLEPKRSELPQDPHAQTDFTAYTLELGEIKLGLASITVGAAPRTQVGTVPVLDALGVYNGHLKVTAIEAGPYALGLGTSYFGLRAGDMNGSSIGLSMIQSINIIAPWSVHFGVDWSNTKSNGIPDLDRIPSILTGGKSSAEFQSGQKPSDWDLHVQDLSLSLATDVRFNRRDSLILQARAVFWSNVITRGYDVPPLLGMDKLLNKPEGTSSPIGDTYVASLAWQWSWRRTDLRVGAGISSVPGAWLLQSTDLSYRFGGKTRRTERRMNKTWKRNKSDTNGR